MLFALCRFAEAQQPKKVPRIGFLSGTGPESTNVEAFRQGLQDLGYVEGKNILVEYRYLEGQLDRIPSLVAELVQLKADVLVLVTLSSIRAAKQATKTIPIVIVTNVDPVATGLVDSLGRPGGNITGLTRLTRELSGKRLELLKETIPGVTRVGVLWNTTAAGPVISFKEYEAAARAMKVVVQSIEVRGPNIDLEGAFRAAPIRSSRLVLVDDVFTTGATLGAAALALAEAGAARVEAVTFARATVPIA